MREAVLVVLCSFEACSAVHRLIGDEAVVCLQDEGLFSAEVSAAVGVLQQLLGEVCHEGTANGEWGGARGVEGGAEEGRGAHGVEE